METLSEVLCFYLLWISWDYVFTGDYKSTFYWFLKTDTTVFIHPISVQNSLSNAWENSCVSSCLKMSFSPLKLCCEVSIPKVLATYGWLAICNTAMFQFCIWEGEHLTGEELSESGNVVMETGALWRYTHNLDSKMNKRLNCRASNVGMKVYHQWGLLLIESETVLIWLLRRFLCSCSLLTSFQVCFTHWGDNHHLNIFED